MRRLIPSRRLIFVIFLGTCLVVCGIVLILMYGFYTLDQVNIIPRVALGVAALCYLIVAGVLLKFNRNSTVAWMLIILYGIVATTTLMRWGVNTPVGLLLLTTYISIGGVMLGAKYIPILSLLAITTLIAIQFLIETEVITPNLPSTSDTSTFTDIFSFVIFLGFVSILSWLARNQFERVFSELIAARDSLRAKRNSLEFQLEAQERILRRTQLAEMQNLYRFAQIGQLTTAILHELANNLSVLTLDIHDINRQNHKTTTVTRAMESIQYLDTMIKETRLRLQENTSTSPFIPRQQLEKIIEDITTLNRDKQVLFELDDRSGSAFLNGDTLRFSQVLTILIKNAIEASSDKRQPARIEIDLNVRRKNFVITVRDFGIGINKTKREKLFTPNVSDKKDGLGMGLFIAKEIAVTHFQGRLELTSRTDCTEFRFTTPLTYRRSR